MSIDELKERVDDIISIAGDDEVAHSKEDRLHLELLTQFLPVDFLTEITRLEKADFARWCA